VVPLEVKDVPASPSSNHPYDNASPSGSFDSDWNGLMVGLLVRLECPVDLRRAIVLMDSPFSIKKPL
jgi:hypothetical protein